MLIKIKMFSVCKINNNIKGFRAILYCSKIFNQSQYTYISELFRLYNKFTMISIL